MKVNCIEKLARKLYIMSIRRGCARLVWSALPPAAKRPYYRYAWGVVGFCLLGICMGALACWVICLSSF